jgi:DNA-binding SARP family transcriptional activator
MRPSSPDRLDHAPRPPDLSVRLFGPVRLFWRSHEVALGSRPAQAFIALLALRRGPWSREAMAAEIWPDAFYGPPARIRQVLWLLRRALTQVGADPAEILATDADTIGLRPGVVAEVDVVRFEAMLRRRPPELEAALGLYRGDLAEDLALECLSVRRATLADEYEDALASVARARLATGDLEGARRAATELLERDPLREEGHAVLIEAYGVDGSRSQAHRQYMRLRAMLASELAADPLPETEAVYRRALARTQSRWAERVMKAAPDISLVGVRGRFM